MRFFIGIIIGLALNACSTTTYSSNVERPNLNFPHLEALQLDDVKFRVIHKDNTESVFNEMDQSGETPLVFGLSGINYKSLAINMEKIKQYLILQRRTIQAYRDYYEEQTVGK